MKKGLQYFGFWFLACTWGVVMTAIGAVVALVLLLMGNKPFVRGGVVLFNLEKSWGLELGAFAIVTNSNSTQEHEVGHAWQNVIWGPLMPFVICIPSAVRFHYRRWKINKYGWSGANLPDYDAIWFEGQASRWGKAIVEYFEK